MQKISDLTGISVRFLEGEIIVVFSENSHSLVDCIVQQTLHLKVYDILSVMG